MLRATLKSLLSRKVRLLLSALAVVLGVMSVSSAFVLTDTLGRSFDSLFAGAYAHTDVEVTRKPNVAVNESEGEVVFNNFPASLVDTIKNEVPGAADAFGVAVADGARVIGKNGKVVPTGGAPQLGVNWTDKDLTVVLRDGTPPRADNEVAMNAALVKDAGLAIGDSVGILTLQPKRTFTLVGVFGFENGQDTLGGSQIVAFTEPVAQELILGEKGVFSTITVTAADGVTPEQLRDRVADKLGAEYVVKTGKQAAADQSASLKQFLTIFNNILLGFAGVALFVGVFLIVNTFSILVAQRTRELALMRAVGASRRQMLGSVLVEAVMIGTVAAVLGLGAGIGIGALLANAAASFADLTLSGFGVPPAAIIGAFAVGIIVTMIAALVPAIRASRIPPVAALQEVAIPDRPLTRITVIGAVVTAIGATLLGLGLRGAGDATLMVLFGGVLVSFVGVALLTPIISRPVVSLIGRLFSWSVPGRLGRLNSGRNPRRTAITAAALMVGIALITGITTVLNSAKTSFAKQVDQQVTIDLVISGVQTGPRPPTFDGAIMDDIAALPGVTGAAAGSVDNATVNGERTTVVAVTDLAALAKMTKMTAVSGDLSQLGDGQVAVPQGDATSRNIKVGDQVTVQLSRGEPRTLTVRTIYTESDLGLGWLLDPSQTDDFGIPQPVQAFIKVDDPARVPAVKAAVTNLLVDSPEVNVNDKREFVEQQTSSVDDLLTMVQVLLALAILIAVLGIINTLALSVLERTRELGLLRAVGLRRGQTMRMVTVEAVVISVFGALLGVTVGAGMGTAVVRALRDEGFTDLTLPWAQMATYLVVAAVVGVLAAVLPAIRAARTNVLTAIAYE